MAHTVFICHSSKDKLVADAACAALEAQRIPCWIAPRDVLAGEEYGKAIIDALSRCQIVLLIFSRHANDSAQVRREIERAASKEKIIVPFRIEDVLPSDAMEYALGNTHWLDAITPPMQRRLDELCETVLRLISKATAKAPTEGGAAPKQTPQGEGGRREPSRSEKARQPPPRTGSWKPSSTLQYLWIAVILIAVVSLSFSLLRRDRGEVSSQSPSTSLQAPSVPREAKAGSAANEQAARDQQARDQAAKDQAAHSQLLREQAAKEQAARAQQARDQAAQELAARDQQARDQAAKEQAARDQQARDRAARDSWTDPATGRMWMRADYDEDITWSQATDYCRSLQLAGHSDWRLATIAELRGIYDASAHVLGHGDDPVHMHVKGGLQISGTIWSSSQGESSSQSWLFDFFLGERFSYPHFQSAGFRALCVRSS